MKSTLLIIASALAISESSFAMEREHPGYSIDPITATIAIAVATVSTICSVHTPPAQTNTNEILLIVDDEQLAALQETGVAVDDESARNRNILTPLFRRLASCYYAAGSSTPTLDLAWLLKMREVVCLTWIAAQTAAKDSLRYWAKDEAKAAANASPLSAAVNANDGFTSWEKFCKRATGTALGRFFIPLRKFRTPPNGL